MIRPAEARDIPGLMNLLHQVLDLHHRGRPDLFKPNATKYGTAELESILADPNTHPHPLHRRPVRGQRLPGTGHRPSAL